MKVSGSLHQVVKECPPENILFELYQIFGTKYHDSWMKKFPGRNKHQMVNFGPEMLEGKQELSDKIKVLGAIDKNHIVGF
jgi:hypothetical protein